MSIDPALLEEFRRQRGSNTLRADFRAALNPEENRFRTWESMSLQNNRFGSRGRDVSGQEHARELRERTEQARQRADQVCAV